MKIQFRDNDCTECWDGVFYKKLSNYPNITEREIQTIMDFISYEKSHGRECELDGEEQIVSKITEAMEQNNRNRVPVENAIQILACGSLLSPVKARKESAQVLMREARNAANDPADYFEYIMFAWGNCQAGDRLVMERKLGRFPDATDLSENFTPGFRFFFKYPEIIRHPKASFEGVLPLKVKDEVVLKDWVHAIIVPLSEKENTERFVPDALKGKVHYIENDCRDIWEWSEKVYEFAKSID